MAGQALEEVGFDFTSVGGLSLTDTSCVDDWLNGYVFFVFFCLNGCLPEGRKWVTH